MFNNIRFNNNKNDKIKKEIKTTRTVIKHELKDFPLLESNTCLAEPNLEILPLTQLRKGLA